MYVFWILRVDKFHWCFSVFLDSEVIWYWDYKLFWFDLVESCLIEIPDKEKEVREEKNN